MSSMERGFTAIEGMIVVAIIGIVLMVAVQIGSGAIGQSSVSFGFNGVTEMRCINGYQFVVGQNGQARQVMDEFGKGLPCQKQR